jgi:hypothetical protein
MSPTWRHVSRVTVMLLATAAVALLMFGVLIGMTTAALWLAHG